MNPVTLFRARLSATLRDAYMLGIFIFAMALALAIGFYSAARADAQFRVAVVNEDQGELGQGLIDQLTMESTIEAIEMDREHAYRLLRQDRLQCLFVITPDFSKRIEQLDFQGTVELTVAPNCAYGASVSEPLVNTVMEMWFERQMLHELEAFLAEQGLAFSEQSRMELKDEITESWQSGAQITVAYKTEQSDAGDPIVTSIGARAALSWYAALCLVFLCVGGGWVNQMRETALLQRLRQSGMCQAAGFLSQAAAQLMLVLAGFLLVAVLGGAARSLPALTLPILLYSIGILGAALVMNVICKEQVSLLLTAPILALIAAFLSGLLMELPEWGQMWVILSRLLPGRYLYTSLMGAPISWSAAWVALGWLLAGFCLSYWAAHRRGHSKSTQR